MTLSRSWVLALAVACTTGTEGGLVSPALGPDEDVTLPGGPEQTEEPSVEEPPSNPFATTRGTVPIYGGTLDSWGSRVVGADPALDVVFSHDGLGASVETWDMPAGSEPFRLATANDDIYVTLRGTGEVAWIDIRTDTVNTAVVCAEPRGIDIDDQSVFVACASGELVELSRDLELQRSSTIAPDLRDVVLAGVDLWLSTFRDAEVVRVDRPTFSIVQRARPDLSDTPQADSTPRVAWRMRAHPEGGVIVLHQAATNTAISLATNGGSTNPGGNLPPNGQNFAYGDPGDPLGPLKPKTSISTVHFTHVTSLSTATGGALLDGGPRYDFSLFAGTVVVPNAVLLDRFNGVPTIGTSTYSLLDVVRNPETVVPSVQALDVEVTAIQITGAGRRATYSRGDGFLRVDGQLLLVDRSPSVDTAFGHFHAQAPAGLACASCHPEGQDDGHVWVFEEIGPRRTQNLAGGLMSRSPFHWDGEFTSLLGLMDDVFTGRMGGTPLTLGDVDDLGHWLDDIPPLRSQPADPDLVSAGKAIFEGSAACISCHYGQQMADSLLHRVRADDVRTKTPSLLGVGGRAPYMHDGCAETLYDRLTDEECGGGDLHGHTSDLQADEIDALVAYLKSL